MVNYNHFENCIRYVIANNTLQGCISINDHHCLSQYDPGDVQPTLNVTIGAGYKLLV